MNREQQTAAGDVPVSQAGDRMGQARRRVERALAELRRGRPVLVADSASREDEVDAVLAADLATPAWIGWMVRRTSGYLCVPMTRERTDRLELPLMVPGSQDRLRTAYTVTADAATGVSTGISAHDRARTARVLAAGETTAGDLTRPGHMLPLQAVPGGVRERGGHTEAAVDLCRLAGRAPVAVIGELVRDDGSMLRLAGAQELARRSGLVLLTVEDLVTDLDARQARTDGHGAVPADAFESSAGSGQVTRVAQAHLPTRHGLFTVIAYRDDALGTEHVALVAEGTGAEVPGESAATTARATGDRPALVRVHSECLTGDAFHSLRCDCGAQLERAMDLIAAQGGVLIRLGGHEGRGIGIAEKVRAYALQDRGRDTAQANLDLGWPVDLREYSAAADILRDLGLRRVRLLTNNPDKVRGMTGEGIDVVERVPLVVGITEDNIGYMRTKAASMGHWLGAEVPTAGRAS
ncbi:bifunctional 3,4-dihydroxy-2-butanone-4-phosphate synthase/GTP cyclohydrolase II [Brooklawnia cerclae]|uniref:GTP cyclohydrolase-2 n=1 Tax=Brooklawnia cerclae TaxID=349934 RepID=A0ABX0SIG2_9ACTN|nr:3,4-dihydroxy 2-butanone 4-phosphate synthase/GTP cyclohydrolase II [Brooklawnia cerclae]